MKKIYVILSHSGTKVSKFFYFCSKHKYTHASICLDDSFNTFYSFARRNIKYPFLDSGITEEHPDKGIFQIYPAKCAVYEITITDEAYKNIQKEINHMLKYKKVYTYNYLGIALIGFHIPIKRKHHFTCTQFVGYLLENNNIKIFDSSWELIQPKHFNTIKGKKIFEGKINDLPLVFDLQTA